MAMHLAYIVGTFPQPSETFIAREVDGLRARGHCVEVFSLFAPTGKPADAVEYGFPALRDRALLKTHRTAAVRRLGARWHARLTFSGFDAVVAHFGSLPSTVALEAAGSLPLILSLHARDLYVEAERLEEKLARAAATVTCTQANQTYLHNRYPAFADRIHRVYHGLPAAWLQQAPIARSRAAHEPLHLLAVGRMVPKKGFGTLLDACALLSEFGVAFLLGIVGDGPGRLALEAQATRLGIRSSVNFPGWLPEEEVRAAYGWADVFCCPSVIARDGDRDGLPNVLVEAMSTGLPAVGSAISGIPEAIDDGDTGWLVPPGDAMALARAISHAADRRWRAEAGAQAAQRMRERFNGGAWLDRLEALLVQSIARGASIM